jgi:hypothetical protein
MRISHKPFCLLVCGVVAAACLSASAEEKKGKADLSGVWQKKDGDLRIEFSGKDTIKISPHGDRVVFTIVCKYTAGKDGLVKAKIAELEGKAEIIEKAKGHVPVGMKFQFKYVVKDDKATLEDVTGENTDGIKSHLEGEYEKK